MSKFKDMSFNKKIEYIWDYYKIHIIAGLSIAILMGYFIYSQVTQINYIFNFTVVGNMQVEKNESFQKELTKLLVNNQNKDQTMVNVIPSNINQDPMIIQKLMAQLTANEIDLILLNKVDFNKFVKEGMFKKLDEVKDLELSSIKYEKVKAEGSNTTGIYAISVEKNDILEAHGIDTKDKVVCIAASTKKEDKAVIVLKWLLK